MTKYDKAVSVCFSGHRSVPFAKRRELKQCLKSEIAKAYARLIAYFDGNPKGGTFYTVREAKRQGLDIVNLHNSV